MDLSAGAVSRKCNASCPRVGFVVGSLHVLATLVNRLQLIDAFPLRATVAHGALYNRVGSNPTQSRAERMAQIVDREIRNTSPLECSLPGLLYASNGLIGIAWTGKEKGAFRSLFVFPFEKRLAGLASQRNGLCRLTGLKVIRYQLEDMVGTNWIASSRPETPP